MLNVAGRTIYGEDEAIFRDTVRRVFADVLAPHLDEYNANKIVPREVWKTVGEVGLLCPTVKEENGGLGLDFRYNAIVDEELAYLDCAAGFGLHSDICANYFERLGTAEQREKYLPGMISGDIITAIAMTEPGAGSDLQGIRTTAIRDGDDYVVNGSKTYITNGQNCDVVIVVAKTAPAEGARGTSLILVEAGMEGFQKGRNLDKVGMDAADTSELFFEDVRVPAGNLLGGEGMGFIHLMEELPQERLSIAVGAQASAQRAFDEALNFTQTREAFGRKVVEFQNTRFQLADMKTRLQVGWAHLDWALGRHIAGELSAEEAAAAKLWHTELQNSIADEALQLHGGAGYMNEYPIAQLWRGARVTRIFGGTNEIMKEVIGRAL